MKPKLYVYPHLGIGDQLVCKGIVMELIKQYHVILLVKKQQLRAIDLLYQYTPVQLMGVESDVEARAITNSVPPEQRLLLGHENLNTRISFDLSYYQQVGLNIDLKWSNFSLRRDLEDERKVYNELVKSEKYIVCHIHTIRGTSHINFDQTEVKDYQIIYIDPKNDGSTSIFSWLTILEKADRVILTNSCYLHLVNQLDINPDGRMYYKSCNRNPSVIDEPILRGKWKII
jgi:hypothetical protein